MFSKCAPARLLCVSLILFGLPSSIAWAASRPTTLQHALQRALAANPRLHRLRSGMSALQPASEWSGRGRFCNPRTCLTNRTIRSARGPTAARGRPRRPCRSANCSSCSANATRASRRGAAGLNVAVIQRKAVRLEGPVGNGGGLPDGARRATARPDFERSGGRHRSPDPLAATARRGWRVVAG